MQSPAENLPLVSIVIPSYNHRRYLAAAIDSVLTQDYPRIELIVIDDGSTDGSPDVLKKYGTRFRWETQANHGQARTMNRGWLMSRGEVLAYLSADDLLLAHAVSASMAGLQRNPDAVLTYCDFNLIDPDSRVIRRVRTPDFDYRDMVTQMICHPGPGAFFRRSSFEKGGEWHGGYRQFADYEFWLRLGLQGRFLRIPEVLAAFRVHPGSQSFSSSPQMATEEPLAIMQAYFGSPLLPENLKSARAQAFSAAHLYTARLHFRAGNYRQGFAATRHAFALYPRNMLSWRTLRLAFNTVFNRIGHRALWTIRGVLRK